MPEIFNKIDKIKPAYDITYKAVLLICKLLLIGDVLITSMSVAGRYISFIPDPAWSEEVVLTCMAYMAVLSAALAIRNGSHIRMTALDSYLPKSLKKALDILADIAIFALAVIMLTVGWKLCSCSFRSVLSACPRQILHNHLSADGERNQLLQSYGGTVLYYHGCFNGVRRYFGETHCFGQCMRRMDAGRNGNG